MSNNLPIEDIETWIGIFIEAGMFKMLNIDTPVSYELGRPKYTTFKIEAEVFDETNEGVISVANSIDRKEEATRKFYSLVEAFYNS